MSRFPEQEIIIDYVNWRGIRALRLIQPIKIEFKSTEFHMQEQWILTAVDVEKGEVREFAMDEIRTWMPNKEGEMHSRFPKVRGI